jgi:hypothetical protein
MLLSTMTTMQLALAFAVAHTNYKYHLVRSLLQDEISEMKRKFKIMGHQIEQLKEELSAKDLALVKEHFDHMKVRVRPGVWKCTGMVQSHACQHVCRCCA